MTIDKQTVRRVSAADTKPPVTSAPASVFAAGQAARPAKRTYRREDLSAVEIRSGVPVPPARTGPHTSTFAQLLERMQPGDMVELNPRQAQSMKSRARSLGIEVTLRKLENGQVGVWRQS